MQGDGPSSKKHLRDTEHPKRRKVSLKRYVREWRGTGCVAKWRRNKTLFIFFMSLQSGMQDREHKFRPVLLGTGEVSEITHFAVCSSTRKSFERKASKCVSRTHKILHPPPKKKEESRVQTCHRNLDPSFKFVCNAFTRHSLKKASCLP